MEQVQIQPEAKHELKLGKIYFLWSSFLTGANTLLFFLVLRKRRKFWGVVYDSVSKQPLDPVLVTLAYADSNHDVQSSVTDLFGRYGFLARPGKFKIFVRKTNYTFPSVRAKGNSDGVYGHLYHGEFFTLAGGAEVVAPNIPMDPQSRDWNQQAKESIVRSYPYVHSLVGWLVTLLFWFVFILAALDFVYLKHFQFSNSAIVLCVYGGLLFFNLLVPHQRLWGHLIVANSVKVKSPLVLELHNPNIDSVVLGKTEIRGDGKFFLLANPGNYTLHVKYKPDSGALMTLAKAQVRVGELGVVNQNLYLS